jgi:hypothetical protein
MPCGYKPSHDRKLVSLSCSPPPRDLASDEQMFGGLLLNDFPKQSLTFGQRLSLSPVSGRVNAIRCQNTIARVFNTAAMSTFHLKEHGNLPVTLPDGLSQEQVLSFRPFNVGHYRVMFV